MNPTPEQEAILASASTTTDNLIVNALAGCGKTSTIEMIEQIAKEKPVLYLAFNKKIADDAQKRMASTTTVRTFNSMGHRIWDKTCNKNLTLDSRKTQTILKEVINDLPKKAQGPVWDSYWPIIQGVGTAKSLGYVPEGKFPNGKRLVGPSGFHAALDETPDDLTADLIDEVLARSILQAYAGRIDYNDQVYMPAVFGGIYPQFPLTFVDEAQDLNPVNHEMLNRLIKRRAIIVGDPYQSIYGFRGAVQSGMEALATAFKTQALDLSVSFRCPSAIVTNSHWRVPHFKYHREGGHVEHLPEVSAASFPDGCTILCRNNAPLFRLAMQLLAIGRSVQVAGSDIGPKLIGIMRKLGAEEDPKVQVLGAIDDWEGERLAKGSNSAADLAECMRTFAEHGTNLGQAIRYAEHLFTQQGTIRLMTGHKSKGLEWDTVYILDEFLCRDDEQDLNLRYVMATRSKDRLYYINSRGIKW